MIRDFKIHIYKSICSEMGRLNVKPDLENK